MNRLSALLAVCALALAGCTTSQANTEEAEFLASVDLGGMDTVGTIAYLDTLLVEARPHDLMAIVRSDELVLSHSDQEIRLVLLQSWGESSEDSVSHSLMAAALPPTLQQHPHT